MSWPTTTARAPVTVTKRAADPASQVLVELVGHQSAHVVRLEDRVERRDVSGRGHHEPSRGGPGVSRWSAPGGDRAGSTSRPVSSASDGTVGGGGAGRPASRTASASASRSSSVGPWAAGSGASRSTSQPARGGEPLAVDVAQVVGVRLRESGQRTQHRGLVGVHVGQRGDRGAAARGTRAPTGSTHAADGTRSLVACRLGSRLWRAAGNQATSGDGAATAVAGGCAGPGCCPARPARRSCRPRANGSTTLVLDVVADLEDRWAGPARPGGVRRRGRPADPRRLGRRDVPLSSLVRGARGAPTRLVLFRRPIEHRCETRPDLEALVLTVVVEQVAELLGIDAEQVDPRYRPRD